MKTNFFGLLTLLTGVVSFGATSLKSPDGRDYSFSDWSSPQQTAVASSAGKSQILKRSANVTMLHPKLAESHTLDFLVDPASQAVWVGRVQEQYFILRDTIHGALIEETRLFIKLSEKVDPALGGSEALLEKELAEFMASPRKAPSVSEATYAIELDRIFGRRAIVPGRGRPEGWPKPMSLLEVKVKENTATFVLSTVAGYRLEVTFDSEFEPLLASKNGRSILILQNGKLPFGMSQWSGPSEALVDTPEGTLTALVEHRSFYPVEDGQKMPFPHMRAVILPTGELWIGPANCRLAWVDDRILGLEVELESKDLLVYVGPRATLTLDHTTSAVLKRELARFEAELKSDLFKETLRINVFALFAQDPSFARDPELSVKASLGLKRLDFENRELVLTLGTGSPRTDLEVRMNSTLKIASTRTKTATPAQFPQGLLYFQKN